jgi:hypothetical protein
VDGLGQKRNPKRVVGSLYEKMEGLKKKPPIDGLSQGGL